MTKSNFSNMTIVTPINKDPKSKSRIDYNEQIARAIRSEQLMWDDAKGNPTKEVGGAFGFVHNGKRVEIYIVVGIKKSSERLDSWSANVGQCDRKVLILSPRITTIDWATWLQIGGAQKVQGTTRVVGAHDNLSNYLTRQFNKMEYQLETNEFIM